LSFEIFIAIELKYNIFISNEKIETFKTIKDMTKALEKEIKKKVHILTR